MLLELTISDFAIIDELQVTLGPHLNVFTGETGAGKSIILDAVSALVGDRVTGDIVRAGNERASVEGIFDISELLPTSQPLQVLEPSQTSGRANEDALAEGPQRGETLAQVLA